MLYAGRLRHGYITASRDTLTTAILTTYRCYIRLLALHSHMLPRARYLVNTPTRLLALHAHMTSVLGLHQQWMHGLETAQVRAA